MRKKIFKLLSLLFITNYSFGQITGGGTGIVPNGYIPRFNGATSVTNSPIWTNGSSVQILSSTGDFRINNSAVGGRSWGLISTGSSFASGAGHFAINDMLASTTKMLFHQNGNIGINNTSPTYSFDISGNLLVSDEGRFMTKIYAGSSKPPLSVATLNAYDAANKGALFAQTIGSGYNTAIAVDQANTQALTIINTTIPGGAPFGQKEFFRVMGDGTTYIDGSITNNALAGTGIRNVLVDASGKLIQGPSGSLAGDWTVGGNTFGGNSVQTFGTLTNDHIDVRTNNIARLFIANNGNFIFNHNPGYSTGNVDFNQNQAPSVVTIGAFGNTAAGAFKSSLLLQNMAGSVELSQDQVGVGHLKWGASNLMYFKGESILIGEPDIADHPTYGELDVNTKVTITTKTANGYTGFPLKIINPAVTGPKKTVFEVLQDGTTHIGLKLPTAPHNNSLLSVDGKVSCKSLYVLKPTSWADYVFKNRKNESLEEVENFISKNNHLPGVPSEEEIMNEGYDINTMDAKLLEKIEKLYLHVIELEKEVKELKKNK